MKKNSVLPGIILILIGFYFLLKQFDMALPYSDVIISWQSILVAIGAVLSFQGFSNKDDNKMFGGIILLGLGLYFHATSTFNLLGGHWAYYTLIISLAFFMKYFVNKRDGLAPAFVLLAISAMALFSGSITAWFQDFQAFWPVLLIGLGIYFLFFKKN